MDREKVINDLQDAVNDDWMWQHADYYAKAMENAIVLLKEQEAVEPTWSRGKPFCGACGLKIHGGKFCSECGKPILWKANCSEYQNS